MLWGDDGPRTPMMDGDATLTRLRARGTSQSGSDLSPNEWARVKEIFHEAVERPQAERAAFVDAACEGNRALQSAVKTLLASDQQAGGFLETPAAIHVGLSGAVERPALTAGQQLGAYTVVSPVGAGGMGEVYRAWDARLQRDVAVKVLPDVWSRNAQRRQQLEQEARAAAALDHPNICAVYDIGEHDGRIWIAMQFIDGETLADRLTQGPLEPLDALDVAEQIAQALSAAHARGIVHRDVKPHNIMITSKGLVKVLDFGVAQTASDDRASAEYIVAGARLGTVPYMSPEQVQGELLDLRTDVFSVGTVFFELVTGRRAFVGESDVEIAAAIVSSTPPDLTAIVPAAPRALDRIARKCLEKKRDDRYRNMQELAADLAEVKQGLVMTRGLSARVLIPAAVLGTAAVAVFAAWLQSAGNQPMANSTTPLQYTRLTNFPDSVHSPALSPDGKTLAFIRGASSWEMAGASSELYTKTLPDGEPVALTDDGTRKSAPTFTPEGSRIVFTNVSPRDGGYVSSSVPVNGGPVTLFLPNASGLRWIGPGQLLFSEMKRAPNMGIVAAGDGSSTRRDVYVPWSRTGMAHFSERSPDGRHVLVVEMENAVMLPCRVVPFDGSSQGHVVGPPAGECTSATWSPDGEWMYFSAVVNGESHLWRQRFPDGMPAQLTFGPSQETDVLVDRDGRSIITSVGAMQSTVWYHDQRGDRPVSVEGYSYRPLPSPDGRKIFYLLRRTAKRSFAIGELWAADLATGDSARVLPAFLIRAYHLSRDGRFIVFDTFDTTDRSRLWIAPTDGSEAPRELTPAGSPDEQRPFFGAGGDIYFMHEQSPGVQSLYRMKPDGSSRRKLLEDIGFLVNISPDEREAVLWRAHRGMSLVTFDSRDERPICTCGLGPIYPDSPSASWSGDGETVFLAVANRTAMMPWRNGRGLPAGTVLNRDNVAKVPNVRFIQEMSTAPGATSARYAFVRQAKQSNLFRIRLP